MKHEEEAARVIDTAKARAAAAAGLDTFLAPVRAESTTVPSSGGCVCGVVGSERAGAGLAPFNLPLGLRTCASILSVSTWKGGKW